MTDYITLYDARKDKYAEVRDAGPVWSLEPDCFYHSEDMIYHAMRKWIIDLEPTKDNQEMLYDTLENLVCVPTVVRGEETVVDFTNSFPAENILTEHGVDI